MTLPKAIFLLGPTASGKTALAMHLADQFPVEIVSVDSALVYRDMNIGTAKPDAQTLSRYPHRLIDLIDPTEAYSAARFCKDALLAMAEITARGNIPLLAGGTMLYAKALLEGLSTLPPADPDVRATLGERANRVGWPAMHAELSLIDPTTAARLKPNDAQRIQRALEVFALTGLPISSLQTRAISSNDFPYEALRIGLVAPDRAILHERIAARFDAMLDAGLVEEVKSLQARYRLNAEMPSMRCVSYRQTWEYLDGKIDRKSLRETGIAATRQLAKRQLTWLRAMPDVMQFDCLRPDLREQVVSRVATFLRTQ
ncbi:MAG: tRNA (adenosine(37)-N6)-dimethylallyltransferase MiaA [Usitatibacteraceae bacterium]